MGAWIETFFQSPIFNEILVAPLWERGLKHWYGADQVFAGVVAPLWERGLKLLCWSIYSTCSLVAPLWERGLKRSFGKSAAEFVKLSLPYGSVD